MLQSNKQSDILGNSIETIVKEVFPVIAEEAKKTIGDIANDAKEAWKEFLNKIKEQKSPSYINATEVELLNTNILLDLIKANIVPNSNEVYVMKKEKEDAYYVYVSYGKDKELIEKEKNKFLVIKAEALSKDVLGLFSESELVILK